ncbi:MAG TPA: ornithine--oxo-acid transaminase [Spirochaetaceae bacterium]|nr:ornithine--oxo-acid transaminase [Spirochaetaceae bacterium]
MKSQDYIALDDSFGAHNYHPLPVVIAEARGCKVKDPEGRTYFDFLSAYSAVNQGHLHPRIIGAMKEQLERVTLTSRAFHNDKMGLFLKKLCEYTGFEAALPMNTGAEAVETALKAARRWGAEKRGVTNGRQTVICAEGNFHGRTLAAISMSNDPDSLVGYGPYVPGFVKVPYADARAVDAAIDENTVAVIVEPIQGEAGVVVPPEGYLARLRKICSHHGILLIFDEIQTGFCRTGRRFAWQYEDARPDIMCLGKALGGGIMPISAIVADKRVMDVFTPGTHGSTFGGNPLASAVGIAAIEVLEDERLEENAERLGELFRSAVSSIPCAKMKLVRGKGLLNAVVFDDGFQAWDVCMALRDEGLLAKQTHGNIIRFAPPLVITEAELREALGIISRVFGRL